MEFYEVLLEAHRHCATIYVMGFLADPAAFHTSSLIDLLLPTTATVRVDLRAVGLIDPGAFVSVARALNRWRDRSRGRVTIEFPTRSRPRSRPTAQSPLPPDIFDEHVARSAMC